LDGEKKNTPYFIFLRRSGAECGGWTTFATKTFGGSAPAPRHRPGSLDREENVVSFSLSPISGAPREHAQPGSLNHMHESKRHDVGAGLSGDRIQGGAPVATNDSTGNFFRPAATDVDRSASAGEFFRTSVSDCAFRNDSAYELQGISSRIILNPSDPRRGWQLFTLAFVSCDGHVVLSVPMEFADTAESERDHKAVQAFASRLEGSRSQVPLPQPEFK
jgi:hypothetical protein